MATATVDTKDLDRLAEGVNDLSQTIEKEFREYNGRLTTLEQMAGVRRGRRNGPMPGPDDGDDGELGEGYGQLGSSGGALTNHAGRYLVQALSEGSGSGSFVVPEEWRAQVWDRLAAQSVGLRSGFSVISTESDSLHVPRLTADLTAAWTAEAAPITASDPTISEVIATPRKLAALNQLSNEVIEDSNPEILGVVMQNILRALALKLDAGMYEGSGAPPEIRGLKNVSGIGSVSMGANGATPTLFDPWADAIGTLEQANAEPSAIVMHPRTWQTLLKIKEVSGSAKPVLQESAGSIAQGIARSIYGIEVFLTSQLAITETQGTSTDCSSSYVYMASEILAVRREDARIEVDRSRLFNSDQAEVRGVMRWDLVVPNPAAVVRILGIRP